MPNHVINELIFRDVNNDNARMVIDLATNGRGMVDFSVLIPEPAGELADRQWRLENWNTDRNAYMMMYDQSFRPIEIAGDALSLRFQSAWEPPLPFVNRLWERCSMPFCFTYTNEADDAAYRADYPPYTPSENYPEARPVPGFTVRAKLDTRKNWVVERAAAMMLG